MSTFIKSERQIINSHFRTMEEQKNLSVKAKSAKSAHRSEKKSNPVRYKEDREQIVQAFLKSSLPNWGGVRLIVR